MALDLLGARLTALHDAPSVDAALMGARLTVLHDSPPASAALIGARLTALHGLAGPFVPVPAVRSHRSLFLMTIRGEDPPTSTYGGKVTTWRRVEKTLLPGINTDQITKVFREDSADAGTIAASGTQTINLQTAVDAFGEAIEADDVALLLVHHLPGSAASSVSLQASASEGWTNLLSTAAALTLRPGDRFVVGAFTAGNLPVTATNRSLDLVNDDGSNAAAYAVELWCR